MVVSTRWIEKKKCADQNGWTSSSTTFMEKSHTKCLWDHHLNNRSWHLTAEIHGDGKRFWRLIHLCMTDPLPPIIFQWRTVGSTLSSKQSKSTSKCSDDFIDDTRQGSISWISLWPVLKLETVSSKKNMRKLCLENLPFLNGRHVFRCFTRVKRNFVGPDFLIPESLEVSDRSRSPTLAPIHLID